MKSFDGVQLDNGEWIRFPRLYSVWEAAKAKYDAEQRNIKPDKPNSR